MVTSLPVEVCVCKCRARAELSSGIWKEQNYFAQMNEESLYFRVGEQLQESIRRRNEGDGKS